MKRMNVGGTPGCGSGDDSERLNGFSDLGMAKEALELAREILERPRPSATEVAAALFAVGVHAKSAKRWTRLVIRLTERLPKRTLHAVREDLLTFFAVNDEPERALSFVVSPGRFSTMSRYFALDCLLRLGRLSEATVFAKKHLKQVTDPLGDAFDCEARAAVLGLSGDHLGAMLLRINAPLEPEIEPNILQGILECTCALAIVHLSTRLERLRELKQSRFADEAEITVPGNMDGLLVACEQLAERIRSRLVRLIPEDRRPRYNFDAIQPDWNGCDDGA